MTRKRIPTFTVDRSDTALAYLRSLSESESIDIARSAAKELLTALQPELSADSGKRAVWRTALTKGSATVKLMYVKDFDRIVKPVAAIPSQRLSVVSDSSTDAPILYVRGNVITEEATESAIPVIATPQLRDDVRAYVIRRIRRQDVMQKYAVAVLSAGNGSMRELSCDSDGNALRYIITEGYSKDGNPVPGMVVFDGDISVTERPQGMKILSDGSITRKEWSDTVTINVTHNRSGDKRTHNAAVMDLRQQVAKAQWVDPLGLGTAEKLADIQRVIRILADELSTSQHVVTGMGPVRDSDGNWLFLTSHGAVTQTGKLSDVRNELSQVPTELRYYEPSIPNLIEPSKVRKGIEAMEDWYRSSPDSAAVSVAPLNNVQAAGIATVDGRFLAVVFQSGVHGSGKSYGDKLMDAIQSPTVRNISDTFPKPFLNIGAMSSTTKGGPIRMDHLRGYSGTSEDLVTRHDSDSARTEKEKNFRELLRTQESGGGAKGAVDRAANEVVSRNGGALRTNIRQNSELPLKNPSTVERVIAPPHIEGSFGSANSPFNAEVRKRLTQPDSIDVMHHAWSAHVWYQFSDHLRAEEILTHAHSITSNWEVTARTATRYAANLYGGLSFVRFAQEEYGTDLSDLKAYIIDALKASAEVQGGNLTGDLDLIRKRIRRSLLDPRGICFPGRPLVDAAGNELRAYTKPFPTEVTVNEDSETIITYKPDRVESIRDVGFSGNLNDNNGIVTIGSGTLGGYLVPPQSSGKRGGQSRVWGDTWTVVIPTGDQTLSQFTDMLNRVSDGDTRKHSPEDIETVLVKAEVAMKQKTRIAMNEEGKASSKTTTKATLIVRADYIFQETEEN